MENKDSYSPQEVVGFISAYESFGVHSHIYHNTPHNEWFDLECNAKTVLGCIERCREIPDNIKQLMIINSATFDREEKNCKETLEKIAVIKAKKK